MTLIVGGNKILRCILEGDLNHLVPGTLSVELSEASLRIVQ